MAGTPKSDVPSTMIEGLQQLLPDIANCMAAPDADMPYLKKLQDVVLLKIHQPQPQQPPGAPGAAGPAPGGAAGAGGPGGPPPPGPGAGPGGPPGGGAPNQAMPGMGAPAAPTQPGGVTQPMTPQPDEMRRILAEQAGA